MGLLQTLYRPSFELLTDLYQLTMAAGYWKTGTAERESVFHLYFRKLPFSGGFAVACGLEYVVELLEHFRFAADDIRYLQELKGNDGKPLFETEFLSYLSELRFTGQLDAVPEGTVVFPNQPLVRIQGPILQCQLLESFIINAIGFQSLVATKASRMKLAAQGEPVLEFGLRRAQGIDGALAASRAAYLGGCDATSNVLAGTLFGIPVKGTHAHSWVMSFGDERTAFSEYARAMPNNCILLVDTYNSIQGIKNAIEVAEQLRSAGHRFAGIRLDSGDLAYLSAEARKMLDAAGFQDAVIVASNDLDEGIVESLKQQGAKINVWAIGTKLVTSYDQPALGAVYKLSAIREPQGVWQNRIKLSEQTIKVSIPGILQVRRFRLGDEFIGDAIYDTLTGIGEECVIIDPNDMTRRKHMPKEATHEDLLVSILKDGHRVRPSPSLSEIRDHAKLQLNGFHPGIKRFVNPHQYPAGIEDKLFGIRSDLILSHRKPFAEHVAAE